MTKVLIERAVVEQALNDVCGAKLCEVNSMSSRAESRRLLDKVATTLHAALAEQPAQQEPLLSETDLAIKAEALGIDPNTPGLYAFYVDCISSLPRPAQQQEPVAWRVPVSVKHHNGTVTNTHQFRAEKASPLDEPLYTTPQPAKREQLTPRELELIDGMIAAQLNYAESCDAIANSRTAEKQKEWHMARVALLQKIRAHGIGGQA